MTVRRPGLRCLAAVGVGLALMGAAADDPALRLKDPEKEARARALFKEIRCLVCQNQSIDESDADLAEDLRKIVRAKVQAGESEGEIKRFIVARYGEFALERPVFSLQNAVLWAAPFGVILGGAVVLFARRRSPSRAEAPLSPEEESRLEALAKSGSEAGGPGSAVIAPRKSP